MKTNRLVASLIGLNFALATLCIVLAAALAALAFRGVETVGVSAGGAAGFPDPLGSATESNPTASAIAGGAPIGLDARRVDGQASPSQVGAVSGSGTAGGNALPGLVGAAGRLRSSGDVSGVAVGGNQLGIVAAVDATGPTSGSSDSRRVASQSASSGNAGSSNVPGGFAGGGIAVVGGGGGAVGVNAGSPGGAVAGANGGSGLSEPISSPREVAEINVPEGRLAAPAALEETSEDIALNDRQRQEKRRLASEFLEEVGTNPNRESWDTALRRNNERFRAIFGDMAFLAQQSKSQEEIRQLLNSYYSGGAETPE